MSRAVYCWGVKNADEKYLADSFHHTQWTDDLRAARQFVSMFDAGVAATRLGAELIHLTIREETE